jgi:hypothetical protein
MCYIDGQKNKYSEIKYMFENRVHRRTFAPAKEEAEGVQRKLYNDGFHNLSTPMIMLIKMKENEMGTACSTHGSIRNYVKMFSQKL